jgi:2'-5' RNA ligase
MNGDDTKLRTFIAIVLPTAALRAVSAAQEQIQSFLRARDLASVLRWSPITNLHLTLRFLGDTTAAQRDEVIARLQAVAAQTSPFTLNVEMSGAGVGGFPSLRQPRVLWMGINGDMATLIQLQRQAEEIAQAVGFAPEEKGFSPHLTLARAARDAHRPLLQQVGHALGEYAKMPSSISSTAMPKPTPLYFRIDRLVYYQSELRAGGSVYRPLASLPFDNSAGDTSSDTAADAESDRGR